MAYDFWFWAPLTCPDCGAEVEPQQNGLVAAGLNPQLHDRWVYPGQTMPVEADDFGISYTPLHPPASGGELRVIAGWACPVQATSEWARVSFTVLPDGVRFDSAESIRLTPEELAKAHFIDNELPRLVGQLPPGAERDALLAALG